MNRKLLLLVAVLLVLGAALMLRLKVSDVGAAMMGLTAFAVAVYGIFGARVATEGGASYPSTRRERHPLDDQTHLGTPRSSAIVEQELRVAKRFRDAAQPDTLSWRERDRRVQELIQELSKQLADLNP